ncbi:glycosyltransferase 61 family protein [Vibrio hannami]
MSRFLKINVHKSISQNGNNSRLEVKKLQNVVVAPYQYLLSGKGKIHQGGPVFPDWNTSPYRHYRCGKPVDNLPVVPLQGNPTIKEPVFWCGAIYQHFGHQVSEFSSRILVYKYFAKKMRLNGKYCFAISESSHWKVVDDLPTFFLDILDWFNIPYEQVLLVRSPLYVEQLYVCPQQEHLGEPSPTKSDYIELLTTHAEQSSPVSRVSEGGVFVSKAGLPDARFAAEKYLEECFIKAGISVIKPETLSLKEQINAYLAHEDLFFTEGSAIHGLQLLGKNVKNVHVLMRHKGTFAANRLIPRSISVNHIAPLGFVHKFNGTDALEHTGLSFVDTVGVEGYVRSLGYVDFKLDSEEYRRLAIEDLQKWMQQYNQEPESINNQLHTFSDLRNLVV